MLSCYRVQPHLNAIALVDGNDGNHAGDLNLDSGAVHQLAGGHQMIKQDAHALARVHSERVHLALYLQCQITCKRITQVAQCNSWPVAQVLLSAGTLTLGGEG